MNWRQRGLDLKCMTYRLQVFHGIGVDRWLLSQNNTIVWAWSAPKWLSWTQDNGLLRGG